MFEEKFKILGKNIRKHRKEKGISVREISVKSGINSSYIYKIERGQASGMRFSHIEKIAKALNISVIEIFKNL